ncbi:unnamed protein product [Pneumocystis jirovecii]|uniref:Uncharacterized protein n=2 Tax=Pneumocystis jirovecii TaxID=42068 RepID=L0PGW3_PNEJI|nr:uncharacterized protein T551_02385 [Pneumocystis jirovecii RU7]KTW29111.1 hypothetical protein T551_02385 [Pneumocystis jirovecii RU7]CCJ30865.1 unnamed protein product [Pneumocystis jirovecii]
MKENKADDIDEQYYDDSKNFSGENNIYEFSETDNVIFQKKRRKKEKLAQRKALKRDTDGSDVIDAFPRLSAAMQADHVEKRICEVYSNYSSLELDDLRVSEKYFFEVCWTDDLINKGLPAFLEQGLKYDPRYVPSAFGSPHTIIFAMAALRVANITRSLRCYKTKEGDVAKLFAKHIKLKDHISYLSRTRLTIAVGTPGRIFDLVDNEALKVDFLKWIVLDTTYIDVKKRRFWDMPECWKMLIKLITNDPLKAMLKEGKVKIVYY